MASIVYLNSIGLLKEVFFRNDKGIIQLEILHHPTAKAISLYLPDQVTMLWAHALYLLKLTEEGHHVLIAFEAELYPPENLPISGDSFFENDREHLISIRGILHKMTACYCDGNLLDIF